MNHLQRRCNCKSPFLKASLRRRRNTWRLARSRASAGVACLALVHVFSFATEQVAGIECRRGHEAYHALKLTRFSGGIRVDYVIVATGERTWTNMNSELVRQFRVKAGKQFCMLQTNAAVRWVDFE
jgi:hypothetical protein